MTQSVKRSLAPRPDKRYKKLHCEVCGDGAEYDKDGFLLRKTRRSQITIHHIDGNYLNNNPENLKTLCRKCHSDIHGNVSR
jgi:5-methylcytosine-specific restriction endonuclease McrA